MSTVPGNHFGCYPSWAGPSVGPGTVGSKPVDLQFPMLGLFGLYEPDGPFGLIKMVHLNSYFCSSLNSADLCFGLVTIDPFEFIGHLCKWIKTLCDQSN